MVDDARMKFGAILEPIDMTLTVTPEGGTPEIHTWKIEAEQLVSIIDEGVPQAVVLLNIICVGLSVLFLLITVCRRYSFSKMAK